MSKQGDLAHTLCFIRAMQKEIDMLDQEIQSKTSKLHSVVVTQAALTKKAIGLYESIIGNALKEESEEKSVTPGHRPGCQCEICQTERSGGAEC
jgi:hypothetical protein